MLAYRIGYGEDAHRLEAGRDLWLGGLKIPGTPHGAVAHSDGDAVLHAVADALLSALALGDIGQYFPDTDPANAGMDSATILRRCLDLTRQRGYRPLNVALVVTLDRPKLGALRADIAASLARLLELDVAEVGISFKTSEGLALSHVQVRVTTLMGSADV